MTDFAESQKRISSTSSIDRSGQVAISLLFVLGLCSLLYASVFAHSILFLFPAAIGIAVFGIVAVTNRTWNLYLILAGFILIADFQAGIQLQEVAYAFWMVCFFGFWYFNHLWVEKRKLVSNGFDVGILLFVLYAGLSTIWSLVYGSSVKNIVAEGLVFMMLGFYFPVKHSLAQDPRATRRLLATIAFVGALVFFRNVFHYQNSLASAEQLYQIASGRASSNEALQLFPAIGALVGVVMATTRRSFISFGILFGMFLSGLIITQSRGYWVAFAFAAVVLFFIVDRKSKIRIFGLFISSLLFVTATAYAFFPSIANLILGGLVDRVTSLGQAIGSDISLVNRIYESKAVWSYIADNPILGYGIGAHYSYFNIIYDSTRTWTFIHNGYVGIWFKYGLIGLVGLVYLWIRSIVAGVSIFRSRKVSTTTIGILIASLCLVSQAVVANTSNPFLKEDTVLIFGIVIAVISAGYDRFTRAGKRL